MWLYDQGERIFRRVRGMLIQGGASSRGCSLQGGGVCIKPYFPSRQTVLTRTAKRERPQSLVQGNHRLSQLDVGLILRITHGKAFEQFL